MTSLNDKVLSELAGQAVDAFESGGTALTDSVRKIAGERGFNRDQTARLIEKTNSEAFLRVFPATTDFPLADPVAIIGADAMAKVASVQEREGERLAPGIHKVAAKIDVHDIFGVSPGEKVASAESKVDIASKLAWVNRVYDERGAEKERIKLAAIEQEKEDAEQNLWLLFKQAALCSSVVNVECDLLVAFPEFQPAVVATVSYLTEKFAAAQALPVECFERADATKISSKAVVADSDLTRALKKVFDNAFTR